MLHLQLKQTSPEKLKLTVVDMQKLPDIEMTDSIEKISCLKWTNYNGRRKVFVKFKTGAHKLNDVVYLHRNNIYLKHNENDLNLTEFQSLLAKRVYLLSYLDTFYKQCIVLDKTSVPN